MEEDNVNVNARWKMPPEGVIKINVHSFFSDQQLPNGNQSGIGVVCRNSRGDILRILGGSLCIENRRNNEYNAFMEGLKVAFVRGYSNIILEIDHLDAYWDWIHSAIIGAPTQHARIVQQLNQRKADKNFHSVTRLVAPDDNVLAAYVAQHGAENWKHMVHIRRPFGRIMEIWNSDMGLGEIGPQFEVLLEEEINIGIAQGEVEDPQVDQGGDDTGSSGESNDPGHEEPEDLDLMDANLVMQE
ncbi:hypothetical protein POM88_045985 [Heracleum sosnowskyi]|uniref:RNase H type-1 domain-containing protein n=1 Tax=Heracleum sosnowskyi TaxID=360622 RepID=A0AAD8H809_9APIA|nr:hypothetical protein POM88_045985 [Heracleum sosnowskyi]